MMNSNLFFLKLQRWSGWALWVIVSLYIISGFGMTKQIIDPIFSRYLHTDILTWPLFLALGSHLLVCFRNLLIRQKIFFPAKEKDDKK